MVRSKAVLTPNKLETSRRRRVGDPRLPHPPKMPIVKTTEKEIVLVFAGPDPGHCTRVLNPSFAFVSKDLQFYSEMCKETLSTVICRTAYMHRTIHAWGVPTAPLILLMIPQSIAL